MSTQGLRTSEKRLEHGRTGSSSQAPTHRECAPTYLTDLFQGWDEEVITHDGESIEHVHGLEKGEKKDLRVRQRERAGSLSSPVNIPCYHTFNVLFRVSTKSLQLLKDLRPGFSSIFDLSTHSLPLIPPRKLQEDGGHQLQGLCACCCFYSEHPFSQICFRMPT